MLSQKDRLSLTEQTTDTTYDPFHWNGSLAIRTQVLHPATLPKLYSPTLDAIFHSRTSSLCLAHLSQINYDPVPNNPTATLRLELFTSKITVFRSRKVLPPSAKVRIKRHVATLFGSASVHVVLTSIQWISTISCQTSMEVPDDSNTWKLLEAPLADPLSSLVSGKDKDKENE